MSLLPSNPEIVCLQCGDVGFSNAFVYCVKCLKFAVHRYCLNVIPKLLNEFVRWLCDDCEAEEQNQHPLQKDDAVRHKTRDCANSEHTLGDSGTGMKKNGIVAPTVEEPASQSYDPSAKINPVEHSKSDCDCHTAGLRMIDEATVLSAADESKRHEQSSSQLHEEENIKDKLILNKLSADISPRESTKQKRSANAVPVTRKDQHTLCNNSSDKPYKECPNIGFNERAKLACDSTVSKEMKASKASLKRDHGLHHGSDPETTATPHPFSSYSGSLGSSKKMKPGMPSAANFKDQERRPLFSQHVKKHKECSSGTLCADMNAELRSINLSRESEVTKDRRSPASNHSYYCNGFLKESTISPVVDCSNRSEPVMEPIWRGSFNISNNEDDILEDIMAHLSISACKKVYDEACQFVPLLHLEMLPRSHVWPRSFGNSESGAGNIALYFFPSERSEQFYDDLVDEMVKEELALKAFVKNAELLVFPSTKLHLSHWRFQGKYYLWGVFREKQVPVSRSPSRYNPVMCRDRVYDNGAIAAMKNFGGQSPLSPLSNCSSYGSHTS